MSITLSFLTVIRFLQKRVMDLVKAKVDVDKSCQELKVRCQELEAGQHLSEAAKRSLIKGYMQSPYFKSIR